MNDLLRPCRKGKEERVRPARPCLASRRTHPRPIPVAQAETLRINGVCAKWTKSSLLLEIERTNYRMLTPVAAFSGRKQQSSLAALVETGQTDLEPVLVHESPCPSTLSTLLSRQKIVPSQAPSQSVAVCRSDKMVNRSGRHRFFFASLHPCVFALILPASQECRVAKPNGIEAFGLDLPSKNQGKSR